MDSSEDYEYSSDQDASMDDEDDEDYFDTSADAFAQHRKVSCMLERGKATQRAVAALGRCHLTSSHASLNSMRCLCFSLPLCPCAHRPSTWC